MRSSIHFYYKLLCHARWVMVYATCLLFFFVKANAQTSPDELKKLSIEELLNLEVSLVTRSPLRLAEAASAIQVITADDIRHSGATNIPEALRLVTNLQVAQLNANAWIISSRGFNTIFANKLLVMIDGRTVYTPLFGGVLWELQHVLLEDVLRIEVVSGPGGTLWGANAVNGVINIITRNASERQGLYASALAGSFVNRHIAVRYGGKISKDVNYRAYVQHFDRGATFQKDGKKALDEWMGTQGGFRMDWNKDERNTFTLQGDYYNGFKRTPGANSDFNGQNVLARWAHSFSAKSDLVLQLYFDRYFRDDVVDKASDEMNTADLDFQFRFPLAKKHSILTGVGYRYVHDHTIWRTPSVGILPPKKNLDLLNVFIQDEITLTNKLKATIGTKVLHNVYTGIEVQPSVRLAYTQKDQTIWAAVSRAVRTPSRLDVDYYLPQALQPPTVPSVQGGPNFVSEKLIAYELGYRIQPNASSTFSLSTFYNVYRDVYSVEALPGTLTYQIQNGAQGTSWGVELSGTYQVINKWRLRAGYTLFDKVLEAKPGRVFDPAYLGNDARHQVMLHSMLELPANFHFDVVARFLGELPKTIATAAVPQYFTFDARLAYQAKKIELAIVGQNLYDYRHSEFQVLEIPRSIYGKISLRL